MLLEELEEMNREPRKGNVGIDVRVKGAREFWNAVVGRFVVLANV